MKTQDYTILWGVLDATFRDDGGVDFDLGGGQHILISDEAWHKLVQARRQFMMKHSHVELRADVDEDTREKAERIAAQVRSGLRKRDEA